MSARNRNLRIGFVGVGAMGQSAHLRNYATLDGCDVVALAEPREGLARRVAAKYGVPKVYRDAAALLGAEKVDAIVASQQFNRHGIVIGELLQAGIPVFIEKPLAASIPVAERLAAADQAAGGKLMVGYHKRSDPATICAKAEIVRLIGTGELGKLRYLRVTMPPGDFVQNGFFDTLFDATEPAPADIDPGDPALDAASAKLYGEFVNFYVHQLNLARHLIGEPYRLSYVDPSGIVIVGHGDSGVAVTLEVGPYTTSSDWQETALAAFERGYVKLSLPAPLALNRPGMVEFFRNPAGAAQEPPPPPYPIRLRQGPAWLGPGSNWPAAGTTIPRLPHDHAMRVQAANFLRFVRGEAPPTCGGAEALEDLRLARAWLHLRKGV